MGGIRVLTGIVPLETESNVATDFGWLWLG